MRRRRPGRPGVTAAATTAVFATGAGPGVTALATTAVLAPVLATGAPTAPPLPARAALRGISVSYARECVIGLDGGDDRLNRNPSGGDQLAARAPRRRREAGGPQVLPNEHAGGAAGLHRRGEVEDVLLGQELGQFGLQCLELSELADVAELHRLDSTVLVLGEDDDVDHADRSRVDQREQLRGHLAGEVARSRWELDDEVVDGAEVIQGCLCHRSFPFLAAEAVDYWRAIATRRRCSGPMRWSASAASSPRSIWTQLTVPVKTLLSPW